MIVQGAGLFRDRSRLSQLTSGADCPRIHAEMGILIRKVRRRDKAAWLTLRRRLWPEPRETLRREIECLFGKRGFLCLIAWQEGKVVGFAEAMIRPFANGCESAPVPFLEGLWVEPASRRKGIGRLLVQGVESWAQRKGFRELGSDAYLTHRTSHKAHRAYGFRETERVVYFKKSL